MVEELSAFSVECSWKKASKHNTGEKLEQPKLNNKLSSSSRLTVRALARGAASMSMGICRNRQKIETSKKKVLYCKTSLSTLNNLFFISALYFKLSKFKNTS